MTVPAEQAAMDADRAWRFLCGAVGGDVRDLVHVLRSASETGTIHCDVARALAMAFDPEAEWPVRVEMVSGRRGRRNSAAMHARKVQAVEIVRREMAAGHGRESSVQAAVLATKLSRGKVYQAVLDDRKIQAVGGGAGYAGELAIAEAVLAVFQELGPGAVPAMRQAGLWPPTLPGVPVAVAAQMTAEELTAFFDARKAKPVD